jgi:hypothetical protein
MRQKQRLVVNDEFIIDPESSGTVALAHYSQFKVVFGLFVILEQSVAPTNGSPVIPPPPLPHS